jgi:hypothetical protein
MTGGLPTPGDLAQQTQQAQQPRETRADDHLGSGAVGERHHCAIRDRRGPHGQAQFTAVVLSWPLPVSHHQAGIMSD